MESPNKKQILHFKNGNGREEHIPFNKFNFHPILKDIENIFWLFILSNKALALSGTQEELKNDEVFSDMIKKFNESTGLETNIEENGLKYNTELNVQYQMVFLGKAMAILTFDFLSSSKYQSAISQSSKFQFLRHIRNGAAHHNTFNLKDIEGEWKIEENESISWEDKTINRSLHKKKVFPNFFSIFEMFFLAYDFSKELKTIDDQKSKHSKNTNDVVTIDH
jgi:hypothetical protein